MKHAPHPMVALIVAWLVPGAGHWLLGLRLRAVSYCVAVILTFVIGWLVTDGVAVSYASHPIAFWLQLPAGLLPLAGVLTVPAGELALPSPAIVAVTDVALTFTMVAGMLNVLLMHDAFALAAKKRRGGAK